MPFPTVDGKTFEQNVAQFIAALEAQAGHAFSDDVWHAAKRLFKQIDAVYTQLYHDVQKLKQIEHERSGKIGAGDPSQMPIP